MTDDIYKKLAELGDADRFFRDGQQSAQWCEPKRTRRAFRESRLNAEKSRFLAVDFNECL